MIAVQDLLADDRSIVDAVDLAVAGLGQEANCEHLTEGVRKLLSILEERLAERADQIEELRTPVGGRAG